MESNLSGAALQEVKRILYGRELPVIAVSAGAAELSARHGFDVRAFQVDAAAEQLRKPRVVRIGAIQHASVLPTTAPFSEQYAAIERKGERCETDVCVGFVVV